MLAAASLAALASAAASRPERAFVPAAVAVPGKEPAPLLGLAWNQARRRNELVHVDPASLRPSPEPALGLGTYWTSWAYSPDGTRLAVTPHSDGRGRVTASLQIVSPQTLRRELALPLGYGEVRALAWLEPDRVLAARIGHEPERLDVLTVAPSARRILARSALQGEIMETARTRDALVLLLAPRERIGAATLVVAAANGDLRSVPLDRVWIGRELPGDDAEQPIARRRTAGLAVDPDGARAFVFPAGSDAAEVDLRSMTVTYRSLAEPVSALERLRRFLDPAATAKMLDGPSRSARWLGGGLVAVTGLDHATWRDRESRLQMRTTPAGLVLVDTRNWRARTIDRGASVAAFEDGTLLVTGAACESEPARCSSMGLAAYDVDGERRFRLFDGEGVGLMQVFGGLAYVEQGGRSVKVVDVASGRVVGTRTGPPPWLLVDGASAFGG